MAEDVSENGSGDRAGAIDRTKYRPFSYRTESVADESPLLDSQVSQLAPEDTILALLMDDDTLRWSAEAPSHAALQVADSSAVTVVRLQLGCAIDRGTNEPYRWCKLFGGRVEKIDQVLDFLDHNITDKSLRVTAGTVDMATYENYHEEFKGTLAEYKQRSLNRNSLKPQ
ncbi:MAG TPA: hypothetical protein VNA13_02350 [Xanthomonadales bacterium]|nr:hypothetical protein [Xanthomonadales bacterium]